MTKYTSQKTRDLFMRFFNNQTNMFTRHATDYFTKGNLAIETSEGHFMGTKLFGVTVLRKVNKEWKRYLSADKPFNTREQQDSYVKSLLEDMGSTN